MHVRPTDGLAERAPELLDAHRELLAELGGTYQEVAASDVGEALVDVAKAERATQLVLGASRSVGGRTLLRGSVVTKVLRAADEIDVHVIATDASEERLDPVGMVRRRRPPAISRRRQALVVVAGVVALPIVTVAARRVARAS